MKKHVLRELLEKRNEVVKETKEEKKVVKETKVAKPKKSEE